MAEPTQIVPERTTSPEYHEYAVWGETEDRVPQVFSSPGEIEVGDYRLSLTVAEALAHRVLDAVVWQRQRDAHQVTIVYCGEADGHEPHHGTRLRPNGRPGGLDLEPIHCPGQPEHAADEPAVPLDQVLAPYADRTAARRTGGVS